MTSLCKHITQKRGIPWLGSSSYFLSVGPSFRGISPTYSSVRSFGSCVPRRSPVKSNANFSPKDPFDRLSGEPTRDFSRPKYGTSEPKYNSRGPARRDDKFTNEQQSPRRAFDRENRGYDRENRGYDRENRNREIMYDRQDKKAEPYGNKSMSARDRDPRSFQKAEKPTNDLLYSPNVVLPALKNGFRTPRTLYYTNTVLQNRKKIKEDPVKDCIDVARELGIPIIKVTKHELNTMAEQRPHQGVILEATRLKDNMILGLGEVSVDNTYELIRKPGLPEQTFASRENEPPVWIALDEVVDPQNLGAILRTALFMGVDGVVVCQKNSAPLSAVVSKASVGALEARPTYAVQSLMRFIQTSQKKGWHVVGAHVTYGSKRNRPLHRWPESGIDQPTILVVGNEGVGLRKQIMRQCDTFIQIPKISRMESNVDSLNVSVAAGVILSKLLGGRFLNLPKDLKKFPLRNKSNASGVPDNGDDNDEEDDDSSDSSESDSSESDSSENDSDSDSESDSDDDEEEEGKSKRVGKRTPIDTSSLPF